MSGRRADGTNPRAQGTNPRATEAVPGAASSGGGGGEARREVSTQINRLLTAEEASLALVSGETNQQALTIENRPLTPEEIVSFGSGDVRLMDPRWTVGEEKKMEPEKDPAVEKFMRGAEEASSLSVHETDCVARKGKECACRDNLKALADGRLKELEKIECAFNNVVLQGGGRGAPATETIERKTATLVRVDDGRKVSKVVPDPVSAQNPPITIWSMEPPRWICLSCALSMRGTDISHRCEEWRVTKVQAPPSLDQSIPPETKFGGQYRLTVWRDRAGDYHLGEEVVVGGRVVEERAIAGPEAWNVIEGAVLDAAVNKLSP